MGDLGPDFNNIFSSMAEAVLLVGTTPIELKVGATALPGRELVTLFNDTPFILYYGGPSVSSSGANKGTPVFRFQNVSIAAGENLSLWIVAPTAGPNNNLILKEWAT